MLTHRHPRRGALGLTTLTLAAAGLLAGCGDDGQGGPPPEAAPSAQQAATSAEAEAAAGWLAGELEDGLVTTSYQDASGKWVTSPDPGLSLDVHLALARTDDFDDQRREILDAVEEDVASYVGSGRDRYAGATGKLLTAVQVEGIDPTEYADGDLLTVLEELVVRSGAEEGRAKDTWSPGNEFGGDYSNTIGQSYVVRALAAAGSDLADEATTFLLAQQCAEGFFRVPMESEDFTCDGGTGEESAPSVDATAFAVLALAAVQDNDVDGVATEVTEAMAGARDWLLVQQRDDGSFVDTEGGQPNANSTGMAGEALRVLGEPEAAASAAEWVADLQVGEEAAEGTAMAGEVGAVGYDPAALEAALDDGLTRATRGQWLQATAQSVGALGALNES